MEVPLRRMRSARLLPLGRQRRKRCTLASVRPPRKATLRPTPSHCGSPKFSGIRETGPWDTRIRTVLIWERVR